MLSRMLPSQSPSVRFCGTGNKNEKDAEATFSLLQVTTRLREAKRGLLGLIAGLFIEFFRNSRRSTGQFA